MARVVRMQGFSLGAGAGQSTPDALLWSRDIPDYNQQLKSFVTPVYTVIPAVSVLPRSTDTLSIYGGK